MTRALRADSGNLLSDLRLPRWLSPATLSVIHAVLADGELHYTLDLHHPGLRTLIHQVARFRETEQWTPPCFGS